MDRAAADLLFTSNEVATSQIHPAVREAITQLLSGGAPTMNRAQADALLHASEVAEARLHPAVRELVACALSGEDSGGADWSATTPDDQLTLPFGAIAETFPGRGRIGSGNTGTLTSGTLYFCGGAVIPSGKTVRKIRFRAATAPSASTHTWGALILPDPDGAATGTVVATTQNLGNATLSTSADTELSFATGDGGSGVWLAGHHTPVLVALVLVGTGTFNIRGVSASGNAGTIGGPPYAYGSGPTGLTVPSGLAGVITLNAASAQIYATVMGD